MTKGHGEAIEPEKPAVEAVRSSPSVITISKETVDAAKPRAARYILWDNRLKGFGLRIEPSGAKSYVVRYRAGGGRRGVLRQFKIGTHGRLTPDQARKAAGRRLAEAELGGDPQSERVAKRQELTVAELCDLYLREGVDGKKPSTLKLDRIRIDRHIVPRLGRLPIGEVHLEDVQRLVRDVAAGKVKGEASPHTRGGPGAAARTAGLMGAIYALARLDPAFGYAERFDEATGRYAGLAWGKAPELFPQGALLVRSDAVQAQLDQDAANRSLTGTGDHKPTDPFGPGVGDRGGGEGAPAAPAQPTRFYGTVALDMVRPVKAFEAILNAVIMELQNASGAKVTVTLDIQAEAAAGFSDADVGVVRDNAKQLKFKPDSTGFG